MIYCSESSLQPIINELEAAHIFNVPFWMARPDTPVATAESQVNTATGNYPCGGVQYGWHPAYDSNVWNSAWLTQQSGLPLVNTVSVGNSGPAVVGLQELLNGLPQGAGITVDGLCGTGTLKAVLGFQKSASLAQDGIVGPLTWAALIAAQVIPVPVPVPPKPDPKTYPAPAGLGDRVLSTGSLVTFSWQAVPGAAAYTLQIEIQKGSSWVLTVNQSVTGTSQAVNVSPRSSYRWRVAVSATGHAWPAWVPFKTT
jgi:peptidoglycan hydrolase-like protein with peptidoglycan-binding domain